MFDNTLTIVISHYCIFTEALPRLIPRGFRLLSSLPRLRFSSHRGEFAAITFGKDEVLPRANGPIVSSGTVAKKGAKTAAEKAVTKTGEFAGNKAGDKIIQLLSKKQPSKTKSVTMSQPKMVQPLTDFQIAERVNRMISGGKLKRRRK